jgi:hypothetical protein
VRSKIGERQRGLSGEGLLHRRDPLQNVGIGVMARHGARSQRQARGGRQRGRYRIGVLHGRAIRRHTAGEQCGRLGVDYGAVLVAELILAVIGAEACTGDGVSAEREGCVGGGETRIEAEEVGVIEGLAHATVAAAVGDVEGIFVAVHLGEGREEVVAEAVVEGECLIDLPLILRDPAAWILCMPLSGSATVVRNVLSWLLRKTVSLRKVAVSSTEFCSLNQAVRTRRRT